MRLFFLEKLVAHDGDINSAMAAKVGAAVNVLKAKFDLHEANLDKIESEIRKDRKGAQVY